MAEFIESTGTPQEILLVEDSAVEAELLRRSLTRAGYRVTLAKDGEEALQAARTRRPALILSDIRMPRMDGYQLCHAIKYDDALWNIPVILLTVLSEAGDIMRAINVGADGYAVKPFVEAGLVERIRALLALPSRRKRTQERRSETVELNGRSYTLTSNTQQILNLLISVYESTLFQNRELTRIQTQISLLNASLEGQVRKRTMDLETANAHLRRLTGDLEHSNADLEQFAYVASHDLQEPLRMISSYLQLIERRYRGRLDTDADEFIDYAVNGALRMKSMINDLLDYSRVGTRGSPFAPTDCESILKDVLRDLELVVEEGRAEVSHDPLPTVLADAGQLSRLFQNLIGNALKFRRPDPPPRVHIGAERVEGEESGGSGAAWRFSVRDNGIGIAPEYHRRIFQIFERLHGKDAYPGSGIGLAICKKIVERHGGRLWLESAEGSGTSFFFTIPGA